MSTRRCRQGLLTACTSSVPACSCFPSVCGQSGLAGRRKRLGFVALALALGWFAEEMGSSQGWFFGRYHYTTVLGPELGNVPVAIALMWFALCWLGYAMASLILWRKPVLCAGWPRRALTAWLGAMIVTAFDLGADPYFVFVLKAWIMQKTDGGWFGETLQGFAGWMVVSFAIVLLFQTLFGPRQSAGTGLRARRAALAPIAVYAAGMVFQMLFDTRSKPAPWPSSRWACPRWWRWRHGGNGCTQKAKPPA
ncbi:MAG: carotenoid biosynthesis protein [Comamonadaceae bacterium]|nr:carotenoid biosynthesis protein [Comamonadaceae bacterium]